MDAQKASQESRIKLKTFIHSDTKETSSKVLEEFLKILWYPSDKLINYFGIAFVVWVPF